MDALINAINAAFGLMFVPFEGMRPDWSIFIISCVTGIGMLYLYVWTSNQEKLKAVQAKIKAHILEIQLYKTDLGVIMRALYRVFRKNFTYLWYLTPPALFLIVLVIIIVVQCYPRYQYRPLMPGERTLVRAGVKSWDALGGKAIQMNAPDSVKLDAQPLAVPALGEVYWRVFAPDKPGDYVITFRAGGETMTRTLRVGEGLVGVSPRKGPLTFAGYIENPLETPVAASSVFSETVIEYPERDMDLPLMLGINWIIYFFVVSFLVAVIWKYITGTH